MIKPVAARPKKIKILGLNNRTAGPLKLEHSQLAGQVRYAAPRRRGETGRGINVGEGTRTLRTSDEAEADAHAAAGADAEGRAQLAERIRPRHREAPQRPPPPAAWHLPPIPTSALRPLARCARPSKTRGG